MLCCRAPAAQSPGQLRHCRRRPAAGTPRKLTCSHLHPLLPPSAPIIRCRPLVGLRLSSTAQTHCLRCTNPHHSSRSSSRHCKWRGLMPSRQPRSLKFGNTPRGRPSSPRAALRCCCQPHRQPATRSLKHQPPSSQSPTSRRRRLTGAHPATASTAPQIGQLQPRQHTRRSRITQDKCCTRKWISTRHVWP